MATLIAYYSRAGEKYFDGAYRMIRSGTRKKPQSHCGADGRHTVPDRADRAVFRQLSDLYRRGEKGLTESRKTGACHNAGEP